jgi:hypothetical protein
MKRFLKVFLLVVFVLTLSSLVLASLPFKIGVVTGTVSQNEEEYRAGERIVQKYGADKVIHVTYPDNFMQEQETTISQILRFAYDRDVKVVVISQAVPGTVPAIRRVRQIRKDIIFAAVVPHEDPYLVSDEVDLAFQTDDLGRGRTITELAKKMGADTILHYSFPRHMSYELLAQRRDLMEKTANEIGLKFVFVSAPDPMGEQGIAGTQQFMMEDIPRQLAIYGKNTAVFGTNCAMQEQIITQVLAGGAIYPEQCCPSPAHAYPSAIGLEVTPEMQGAEGIPNLTKAINERIIELGGAGRFATWPVAFNYVLTEAAVEIVIQAAQNKIDLSDMAAVKTAVEEVAKFPMHISRFDRYGNFYLLLSDSIIFGN